MTMETMAMNDPVFVYTAIAVLLLVLASVAAMRL